MNSRLFNVGDIIRIYIKDIEEHKVHTTFFEGVAIAIRGQDANKTFTVRRIASDGVAVERIFPFKSPAIEKIKIIKPKSVKTTRRAKLYFLRKKK